MTLMELGSSKDLVDLLRNNKNVCITFSAHWCGPCKRSKPQLEQLASKMCNNNNNNVDLKMAIVYESDLGNDIHAYNVRAFPTYIFFVNGQEKQRVEGANLALVQSMLEAQDLSPSSFGTPGATLGGGSGSAATAGAALTPEQARAQRLAKLDKATTTTTKTASSSPVAAVPTPMEEDSKETSRAPAPIAAAPTPAKKEPEVPTPMEEDDAKEPPKKETTTEAEADSMEVEGAESKVTACTPVVDEMVDPTIDLDPEHLKTLTESMGFSLLRAQKGLLYGTGNTPVEGAVEWLLQHQDDDDIDDSIPLQPKKGVVAQSYKCNTCGKILSNMANLELHANKTGHADFEESTQHITPFTAEEKAEKLANLKELLKLKRAEREEAEKVDDVEREKQRRNMGKEILKTKEQLEMEQRKREAALRKREKEAFKRERDRLRAELAKDKAERIANAGKLSSRIGVDGYAPDGIQYDVDASQAEQRGGGVVAAGAVAADAESASTSTTNKRAKTADASKIDDYIKKVASYKAGGDGGKCLKVLKIYIANVVDNPTEEKYKTINMENKAYKAKVKPFVGAKSLLLAVGFQQAENDPTSLILDPETDAQLLASTKQKLEDAIIAYG
jgi:UBX domain-containing protein 1/4